MKTPIPNSYWVIPGRLLAGEYPLAGLELLLEAGINSFIDLTEPDENEPYRDLLPYGVEYHSQPLEDHGVPNEQEKMRVILATLRRALTADRRVYLHCRAGIGRTGMAIGCYLAEEEGAGSAALVTLNNLWLQNARAKRWPRVPETPEQEVFVRQWEPDVRVPVPGKRLALSDRYRGCLLGLATGDALAVSTQGMEPGQFTPVTAPVGGGEFALPRGVWTDDTAMALCVAESFIECRGFDARDQMSRYRRWQNDGHLSATGVAVGLRPAVAKTLALAAWRRYPVVGSHDPKQLDKEPLARCAAPALFFGAELAAAAEAGADTARVTHQAPIVVDCCSLFTGMIQTALAGGTKAEILALAAQWPGLPLQEKVLDVARTWPRPRKTAPAVKKPKRILGALDAIVEAFADTNDFASGALRVANLGGDSDVLGAGYGQLAGAYYGVGAIPRAWRTGLAQVTLIESLADRLLRV